MKKKNKNPEKLKDKKENYLQITNTFSKSDNMEPLPQPKDYDEIEY